MKTKKENYLSIDFRKRFTEEEIDIFKETCYRILQENIGEIGNLVKKDEDAKIIYFHFIFLLSKHLADIICDCDKVKFIESLSEQLSNKKLCDDLVFEIEVDHATFHRA
jgi:hypothetical protein